MQPPLDPPDEPDEDDLGRLLDWDGEVKTCRYCGDEVRVDGPSHTRCRQIDREPACDT